MKIMTEDEIKEIEATINMNHDGCGKPVLNAFDNLIESHRELDKELKQERRVAEKLAEECGGCPKGMKYIMKSPPTWCTADTGCSFDIMKLQCWLNWAGRKPNE